MVNKYLIIIRGGGDLATGTIHRLWAAGLKLLVLEAEHPAAIRRQVAVSEAVYEGQTTVEGMTAVLVRDTDSMERVWAQGKVPLAVDPKGTYIKQLKPLAVVDAILAKRNLGTTRGMAKLTVGLGPGFMAGKDVDAVIETKRGHNLGRIIWEGSAEPNTGIPGIIGGYGAERVIHAAGDGIIKNMRKIGDIVEEGEIIAYIQDGQSELPVTAAITGIIRGLIRDGYPVTNGFKIADIDPRKEQLKNCFTISDKARCIAGSVLETICTAIFSEQ